MSSLDPEVWIVRLSIGPCLIVRLSDLLHDDVRVVVTVWISEIRLGVVELIDNLCEIVAELSCPIRLIAALEISQQPGDDRVGCTQEDARRSRPTVLERPKHGETGRDDDLDEKQSVRPKSDKPVLVRVPSVGVCYAFPQRDICLAICSGQPMLSPNKTHLSVLSLPVPVSSSKKVGTTRF